MRQTYLCGDWSGGRAYIRRGLISGTLQYMFWWCTRSL